MLKKIESLFALSPQGARDLVKSSLWSAFANLTLMLPVGLCVAVVELLIGALDADAPVSAGTILLCTGIGVLLLALIFAVHYVQYARLYLATYSESAERRIRLAEKLRRLPLAFFGRRDLADLTNTIIADCASLEQAFSHYIPQLFGSLISIAVVAAGLLALDWRLALAVLWVLPVAFALCAGSKAFQDRHGRLHLDNKRKVADGIQECLETVRELKADNLQSACLRQLDAGLREAEQSALRSELATGIFVSSAQLFLRFGLATTVLAAGTLLVEGKTDFLTCFVFLLAASRLYDPLSLVMINIGALFAAGLRIERMKELENQPAQTGRGSREPKTFDIRFENVTFAYPGGERVLDGVSFTAKQGEVTALVGPSGGGKSTAARLAARFWDIGSGRITLGGIDISGIDPETLLANYSVVFQDVVLFRDTILENIRLGRRGASDEEVRVAAEAARCGEFIARLPDGYRTVIGENGATLSGGERQRISIARALLKDAPVILLDEATASLDAESETMVQKALSVLVRDKTVLVIAHRLRTVAGADKVVVLENGRVAETGTPWQLLEQDGLYRRMVLLQS